MNTKKRKMTKRTKRSRKWKKRRRKMGKRKKTRGEDEVEEEEDLMLNLIESTIYFQISPTLRLQVEIICRQ